MFESLIESSAFPSLIKLIDATDKSLVGVKERLMAQAADKDHLREMAAEAQLDALAAWEPALKEIRAYLDSQISHPAAPHAPLPGGHR